MKRKSMYAGDKWLHLSKDLLTILHAIILTGVLKMYVPLSFEDQHTYTICMIHNVSQILNWCSLLKNGKKSGTLVLKDVF